MSAPVTDIRDTDADLIRLVALHAGVVFAPSFLVLVLLMAVVGLPMIVALLTAVVLAALVGVGVTAWRLRGIDDRLRVALEAEPVDRSSEPRLYNLADSVAMATGVPSPTLHVIEDPAHNAVVWGAVDAEVSLAVTRGLLDSVSRVELEAVLSYQLSMARDGLGVLSTAAALFGPLATGPLVGPVARLVHSTVDDRRIVLADVESARASCFPPGLVSALERLRATPTAPRSVPPALAPLFFASPVADDSPFSVHPPLADRIDLAREL